MSLFKYYTTGLGYIDIEFRDQYSALLDPDQDATFYVEVYDGDDALQDTFTLTSSPVAIESIETGRFKVEDFGLTGFAEGTAYYRWYAKVSGVAIPRYPVAENCFSIISGTSGYNLCTRDDLKTYLKILSSSEDAFLDQLILRATAFIENWCRRNFASREHTDYYTGDNTNTLLLDHRPVTAITTIQDVHGEAYSYGASDEHDYWEVYEDSGLLVLLQDTFPKWQPRTVKIVYTAGFSAIPEDVRQVCIEIAAAKFYLKERQKGGIASTTFGGETVRYTRDDLSAAQKQWLAPYRVPTMGAA